MVGLLRANDGEAVSALQKTLSKTTIQKDLKMVQDRNGKYIRIPSTVLKEVAHFDTEHDRPIEQAPKNGTTTLAHIFLKCS